MDFQITEIFSCLPLTFPFTYDKFTRKISTILEDC